MFKKVVSGLMAVMLAFSLVGCNNKEDDSKSSKKSKADSSSSVEVTKKDKKEETKKETEKKSDSDSSAASGLAADGTYTSKLGYSVKIPAGWEVDDSTIGDAFADKLGNNFVVVSVPSDEQFKKADEAFFKEEYVPSLGTDVELKSYNQIKVAGHKAHEIKIINRISSMEFHQSQVFVDADDNVIIVTFTDVDGSNSGIFDGFMDSLVIFD